MLHETRLKQLLIAVPLFAHGVCERVPRIGRKAETEARDHRRGNGAAAYVVLRRGALRRFERFMKKPRRVPVELQKTRPAGRFLALRFLRQGHIRAPRQKRHGVREREIFDLHDKVDDAAALAAAETVVDLLVGRDGE